MSQAPNPDQGELQLKLKHHLATRWHHWINFPVLGLMVWSGFLIYWANDIYYLGWGKWVLFHFFPSQVYDTLHLGHSLALGMAWHFTLMWIFMFNGLIYVLYTGFSGEWKDLYPGKGALKDSIKVVLYDIGFKKIKLPEVKYNAAQRIAYCGIIVMGALSVATGFAIFKPVQLGWLTWLCGGYEFARIIHFALTIGYCLFFLIHIAQVIRAGWSNFRGMLTGYDLVPKAAETTTEA